MVIIAAEVKALRSQPIHIMFRKPRKAFVALLTLLTILFCIPGSTLALTTSEEEKLSKEFLRVVQAQFPLIRDPMIVSYINRLGYEILQHVPPQPFTYRFYVLDDHVYNAFATPAGHIFFNRGLIEAMKSEDELAGILAHEISHVVARHISDKIERSKKINMLSLAGMVAGAFLGSAAGSGDAASALTMGSLAASQSLELSYSRQDEIQADQLGLIYLNKSGYSAKGLMNSLQTIRSKQWFGSVPNYLLTHPATEDRIAYIDAWIEKNQENQAGIELKRDSTEFQYIRTRLSALYGDEDIVRRQFENQITQKPGDPVVNYGMGLFYSRVGQRDNALKYLRKALSTRPLDPYILTDLGKVYYQSGRYDDALRVLEGAENIPPYNPEHALYFGQTLAQLGQTARAKGTLENLISRAPGFIQAYYALGQIHGNEANESMAHYYLGLYYRQKGDMRNALFHLNRSFQIMEDPEKREEISQVLKSMQKPSKKKKKKAG